jgi:hypothetical protein
MSLEDPSTWPQYATIDPEFQGVRAALLNKLPKPKRTLLTPHNTLEQPKHC